MNWISVKDRLPEYEKIMLLWAFQGHRWGWYIGALHDMNGDNGHTEWIDGAGNITKQPNKEYPENLEWSLSGHWRSFENVSHWAVLPEKPNK